MVERTYEVKSSFKDGVITSIPVVVGYFPVAMAFGLLSKSTDISLLDSFLFSVFVYAGASQFMALDLIKASIGTGSIILSTFLLNLRHGIMSASLALRLKNVKRKWLYFIAFGVTDETFSISSLKEGELNVPFLLGMQGMSYVSWICGTIAGYLVGTILPESLQSSLGIGLYAMFMAILMPEIKKSSGVLFISLISGGIYFLISYFKIIPSEWSLIFTIIVATLIGVVLIKEPEEEAK
ncbi:AzlC family ABC transporter permease [Clostridium intestinale]|uniref:AzlC family ABC transporter permease n=1 Tax=Clostridium intestinale TaxID=36845 RepID=UPI0003FB6358|nr:AzlC family ABC transporter permease [Clostridium intestinale]